MSLSQNPVLRRPVGVTRIACGVFLAAVANICAAQLQSADRAVAGSDGASSPQPGNTKPAAAQQGDAPAIEYFPRPTKYEVKIIEALEKPTSVEFLDLALEDCLTYLKEYHGINIWLDKQTLTDEGVALDQPITLKLAGVSLRSILKLLLEPVQLTYVIGYDVMKVTTTAKASERMLTRTYPVRDLYRGRIVPATQLPDEKWTPSRQVSESRPGDLETAIAKAIEPGSWDEKKGPGSITYVSEAGSLVIHQTWWAHEQILQLLRDLRDAKRLGQGAANAPAPPRVGWRLRGPKRAEFYSIVGVIDLDGDENSDAGRLHELVRSIGATIDNEVDEQGVLRVDGEIPDDARPRLTEKTKFVVVGKIPQPADLGDAEEKNTSLKIAEHYKEIEDRARTLGVRIITLEEFLTYIGYERVEGSKE